MEDVSNHTAAISESDRAFHRQIYLDHAGRLQSARQSSFEQFDKAILTLSSGSLALSLGFVQGVLAKHSINLLWLVEVSWGLFLLAIIGTVASIWLAPWAIDQELEKCLEYMVHGDQSARARKIFKTGWVHGLNAAAGSAFLLALAASIVFITQNISKELEMEKKSTHFNDGFAASPVPNLNINGGRAPETRGFAAPKLPNLQTPPPAPATLAPQQPVPQTTAPQGQGKSGG